MRILTLFAALFLAFPAMAKVRFPGGDATFPICSVGQILKVDGTGNFACGTDLTANPGAVLFQDVGAGTSTVHLIIGNGGVLDATGSGSIIATTGVTATGFFSTGTFADARILGSLERDEVLPWATIINRADYAAGDAGDALFLDAIYLAATPGLLCDTTPGVLPLFLKPTGTVDVAWGDMQDFGDTRAFMALFNSGTLSGGRPVVQTDSCFLPNLGRFAVDFSDLTLKVTCAGQTKPFAALMIGSGYHSGHPSGSSAEQEGFLSGIEILGWPNVRFMDECVDAGWVNIPKAITMNDDTVYRSPKTGIGVWINGNPNTRAAGAKFMCSGADEDNACVYVQASYGSALGPVWAGNHTALVNDQGNNDVSFSPGLGYSSGGSTHPPIGYISGNPQNIIPVDANTCANVGVGGCTPRGAPSTGGEIDDLILESYESYGSVHFGEFDVDDRYYTEGEYLKCAHLFGAGTCVTGAGGLADNDGRVCTVDADCPGGDANDCRPQLFNGTIDGDYHLEGHSATVSGSKLCFGPGATDPYSNWMNDSAIVLHGNIYGPASDLVADDSNSGKESVTSRPSVKVDMSDLRSPFPFPWPGSWNGPFVPQIPLLYKADCTALSDFAAGCTASGVPNLCCTGAGTGTCTWSQLNSECVDNLSTNTGRRYRYQPSIAGDATLVDNAADVIVTGLGNSIESGELGVLALVNLDGICVGPNKIIEFDGSGVASCIATPSGGGGGGTVNNVGNCNGPDCFTGTEGTILTSTTGETLNMATANTFTFTRNDAGTITLTVADDAGAAAMLVTPAGAASLTLGTTGGGGTTSIILLTDATGTGEVQMPAGSVDGTEILDDTVTLSTDTNGTYAQGDAEAGNATSGDSATAFFTSGALEVARGGTGAAPASDDQLLVASSTSAAAWKAMPDCPDSGGNHVNYTASSNTFGCGTSTAGAGGWADDGTTVRLSTSTDDVSIGAAPGTQGGKLDIDGDTDQIQLAIQGHSTQTSSVIRVQNNAGTALLTLDNSGNLVIAGSLTLGADPSPTADFDDSDSASEAVDARIAVNSTDPTAGSEDTDMILSVQVGSTLTARITITGTGNTTIPNLDVGSTGIVYSTGTLSSTDLEILDDTSVTLTTETDGNYVAAITGGAGITSSGGGSEGATVTVALDTSEASSIASGIIAPAADGALVIDTNGDSSTVTNDVLAFQSGGEDFFIFAVREYPTVDGQVLQYNAANGDVGWASAGGSVAWENIATAGAAHTLDFAGFDQVISSAEDGGVILALGTTDADQATDTVALRLFTNDDPDANTIFLQARTDNDNNGAGVAVAFQLSSGATAGGVVAKLGATGVQVSTDGDGAITFLSLGNGSGGLEDLTINLDDTSNEATFSSSTGVSTFNFPDASIPAADIKTGLTDAQVSDTLTASIFKGSGTLTDAVDLDTAEVAGALSLSTGTSGNYVSTIATGFGLLASGVDLHEAVATLTLDYSFLLSGNPGLSAKRCIFTEEGTSGGGFLCEGDTANTNEHLHLFTTTDAADTTDFISVGNAAVTFATGGSTARTATFPIDANFTMARQDAAQTFTGVQTMTSAALTTPTLTMPIVTAQSLSCNTATPTWTVSAGNVASCTLNSTNITPTVTTSGLTGGSFSLKIIQASTARTITWPNGNGTSTLKVKWPGGLAPTLSAASAAEDTVTCLIASEFVWNCVWAGNFS